MAEMIKIEVYGIWNQPCKGGCCCSGSCSKGKTMGEWYEELEQFFSESRLRGRIDLQFIDILMDNMEGRENIIKAMDRGYSLPFTAINGKLKYHGSIDNREVYGAVRRSA